MSDKIPQLVANIVDDQLRSFVSFLRRQDRGLDPSVGVMLHNEDLYSDKDIVDLYYAWIRAGRPE